MQRLAPDRSCIARIGERVLQLQPKLRHRLVHDEAVLPHARSAGKQVQLETHQRTRARSDGR